MYAWQIGRQVVSPLGRIVAPSSRILAVDDGPENHEFMSVILRSLKLAVELAENRKVGLDAAVAAMQTEPYDLIFMDIQMPVMDGYEAVSEMRKAGVQIPMVALSAAHSNPSRLPQLLDQLKVFTRQVLTGWQLTPVTGAVG